MSGSRARDRLRASLAARLGRAQPDSPPALFTAIREQLGLRLDAQRAPVDSIVVTRVERPTPN